MECVGADCNHLAPDRDELRAVMNLTFPGNAYNFIPNWGNRSF